MRIARTRLDARIALAAAAFAAALLGGGCEDEPATGGPRYIPLVQPLEITFLGATIAVTAEAALRVDWTVLIENVPADTLASPARHRRRFDDQTQIAFAWDGHNNIGIVDFMRGDSCIASVAYPQMDPAEPGARVGFRLP